jgi:hypothetical protein
MGTLRPRLLGIGLFLSLGACERTAHTPVDLQLDLDGAAVDGVEWLRVCVVDGPQRDLPLRDGDHAVTGLPEGVVTVTVDGLDADLQLMQRFGPVDLVERLTTAEEDEASRGGSACTSANRVPPAHLQPRVLGLRLLYAAGP